MVNCLVQLRESNLVQLKEMSKELSLDLQLEDLMVLLKVMMMVMSSAHLTAHQLVHLLEILANILFYPHRRPETNNILQFHSSLHIFDPRSNVLCTFYSYIPPHSSSRQLCNLRSRKIFPVWSSIGPPARSHEGHLLYRRSIFQIHIVLDSQMHAPCICIMMYHSHRNKSLEILFQFLEVPD